LGTVEFTIQYAGHRGLRLAHVREIHFLDADAQRDLGKARGDGHRSGAHGALPGGASQFGSLNDAPRLDAEHVGHKRRNVRLKRPPLGFGRAHEERVDFRPLEVRNRLEKFPRLLGQARARWRCERPMPCGRPPQGRPYRESLTSERGTQARLKRVRSLLQSQAWQSGAGGWDLWVKPGRLRCPLAIIHYRNRIAQCDLSAAPNVRSRTAGRLGSRAPRSPHPS